MVVFAFEATFCIITVALVSGAVVERMRFAPLLVFSAPWSVCVYAVLAHWTFGGGWLHRRARRRRLRVAVTFALLRLVGLFTPLRASGHEQALGMDVVQHGEEAYATGEGEILVSTEAGWTRWRRSQ